MSIKRTPVITDSENLETLKLAEEISTFLEDQKLKAQDRIRQCEAFINNLRLPSKSVKEGLANLRRNAEDDYSTILHLERVLNMRDGGDFVPTLDTPIIPRDMINSALKYPLPGFTRMDNSGDHVGLSGGGSRLQKNARMSTEDKFASYFDDDHGEGTGFEMGSRIQDDQVLSSELDEIFDPLQSELPPTAESKPVELEESSGRTRETYSGLRHKKHIKEKSAKVRDHAEPYEEEDEEEDYFAPKDSSQALKIGIRSSKSKPLLSMARSLPVSVPLPEGMPKRGEIFDLPSDDDDDYEESDIEKEHDLSTNKKELMGRRKSAIPEKIAMIAKSMYDGDGLGFGESPQKY